MYKRRTTPGGSRRNQEKYTDEEEKGIEMKRVFDLLGG